MDKQECLDSNCFFYAPILFPLALFGGHFSNLSRCVIKLKKYLVLVRGVLLESFATFRVNCSEKTGRLTTVATKAHSVILTLLNSMLPDVAESAVTSPERPSSERFHKILAAASQASTRPPAFSLLPHPKLRKFSLSRPVDLPLRATFSPAHPLARRAYH